MSLAAGHKSTVQFGVERNVKRGIDGLDLLEQELAQQDDASDEAEDENKGWDNFEIDEESSEDDIGWINVESDGEEIEFSDSDDDKPAPSAPPPKPIETSIATTRILTPADFKRLAELKAEAPTKQTPPRAESQTHSRDRRQGRKDRAKFGSHKNNRGEEGRSTTNKEKSKKKNFLMVKQKRSIQGKGTRKLTIKRKELKAHVERGRRGGKRGDTRNMVLGSGGRANDSPSSSSFSHGNTSFSNGVISATASSVSSSPNMMLNPDATIEQLLQEKMSLQTQNAQLWRLVDKQRAM
ncbi:hypothetical protein MRB53_040886 [Persea americana]|nr:hypothetical protein MRB53_040886 [Persea americana]